MASGRPLSELSPVAQRRNSPSWTPRNKQEPAGGDSSPFEISPMNHSNSPHLFWKGREATSPYRASLENKMPYDPAFPMSSNKRSSIENLKRASRVKNSTKMFGSDGKQEYDPAHSQQVDRPLASGRPLSGQLQRNSPTPANSDARRQLPSQLSASKNATQEPGTPRQQSHMSSNSFSSGSPSKSQATPTKSSLSKGSRYSGRVAGFDPTSEIWSDGESAAVDDSQLDRSPNRQAKSVTFDAAPPQVNEYEMTTPVPSSVASSIREGSYDSYDNEDESFEQHSSMVEDSFDASLEDTDKTPVVLPDEWRFMSPDSANGDLVDGEDDIFGDDYGSPDRDTTPGSVPEPQPLRPRVESMDSNGDRRPLPPLPGAGSPERTPEHNSSILSTLERASSQRRSFPSPLRPASCSKADIAGFSNGSVSLEERLRLMMMQDRDSSMSEAGRQRERRLRRMGAKERSIERDGDSALSLASGGSEREMSPDMFSTPPRISRESIMRDIKQENAGHDNSGFSESLQDSSPLRLDPDVPIPSLEGDNEPDHDSEEDELSFKEETEEQEINLYDIPEYNHDDAERDASPIQANHSDEDDGSRYSQEDELHASRHSDDASRGGSTPVPQMRTADASSHNSYLGSADNETEPSEHGFDVDFLSYAERSISPIEESSTVAPHLDMSAIRRSLQRPETPQQVEEGYRQTPPTPVSVIRHEFSAPVEPLNVPDNNATVKAPGAELKTKPSLTPADVETMAAARRKVSGEESKIPPIRENYREDESTVFIGEYEKSMIGDESLLPPAEISERPEQPVQEKRQSSLVKLDIPVSTSEGLGFGLAEEFDRVIEAQKVAFEQSVSQLPYPPYRTQEKPYPYGISHRLNMNDADTASTKQKGYLMRQNTKVVVASSRPADEPAAPVAEGENDSGSAPCANQVEVSPRKASQPTWTTEPWNGKSRRQSIKVAGGVTRKKVAGESVPPLPGHESNVKDVGAADQQESGVPAADEIEDGQERGRLFVKVVGVKNLDLPLPRNERSYFALTLDNGIHCVTTSWLELGKSAPIGQEFELVVLNELEFQLTLQMKLEPPKPKPQPVQAKPQKAQKQSAFSRVFASPKKRREMEMRQQMEAQQQQKANEMAQAANADPWERIRALVSKDGSFARAYVSLTDYEDRAFGRPLNVDATCFNEWAVDEVTSSLKSKRGPAASAGSGVQLLPPYHIGTLELQLLYVPKPKGATDDDLPKSMNACIREMREADNTATRSWEGFLSQQGGDCPYWRRRLFKLQGTKLTAFHEVTRQPRATINLAKAVKLIDDKSILTQKETSAKGGGRRKSAFAEEEEGYMFVEEGFRIRFANGEVIDFYADSAVEKDGWMKVLYETVGKGYVAGAGKARAWTEIVQRRERRMAAAKSGSGEPHQSRPAGPPPPHSGPSHPGSPLRESIGPPHPMKHPMAPPPKPRHQHRQSQPDIGAQVARHQKTRSLIF